MTPKNEVCAIVVTFNRLDMLRDTIKALKEQDYPCDILIINNGSTDGTKKYLDSTEGIMTLHQDNLGGAGGFFSGMKKATELGYRFVWIMDDDVIPYTNALSHLIIDYNYLSSNEQVGFICSQVLSEDGFCANVPVLDSRRNKSGYPDWAKYLSRGIVKVKSATFVSVLIPCNLIFELGLPYKEYFIWGDDTEYTQRISSKFSSYMSGNSKIIHRRIGSNLDIRNFNDKKRIKMFRRLIRNNIRNLKLYNTKQELWIFIRYYFFLAISLLFKGDFYKCYSIMMGFIEAIGFNPAIQHPSNGNSTI